MVNTIYSDSSLIFRSFFVFLSCCPLLHISQRKFGPLEHLHFLIFAFSEIESKNITDWLKNAIFRF